MKIARAFVGGLIGLSLSTFSLPCLASIRPLTKNGTPAAVTIPAGTQIAFGDDAAEHQERREKLHRERRRIERHTRSDADEEHGGTRNFVREHTPGTDEHAEHEAREGEEHHRIHRYAY